MSDPVAGASARTGRTLVVTNDFPPRAGGIESFVLGMVERLPAGSVVVHTARQAGDAAFDAGLAFPVVRDRARLLVPTPAVVGRVAATARAHGCDRVWFGAAAPLGLMAPALRRAGVRRTVATTHGHEVWWAALPGSRAALRAVAERNDVLTHLVEATRRRIAAALPPRLAGRMVPLVPGVDDTRFRPGAGGDAVRARLGLGRRPVVVCVSRVVARKGQDVLVGAWPQVLRQVPGAVLLLVGDGPHRRAVERRVRRLGLGSVVVLTGRVAPAELPACYDAGDVFAMPARDRRGGLETEGLGICYLEAAATGLPVVAGRSGGAPEAVQDGVTGLVVDGRDASAVAAAVAGLLTDPARAAAMGERGRAWVARSWRAQDQADRLQALLVGEAGPPAEGPVADGPAPQRA